MAAAEQKRGENGWAGVGRRSKVRKGFRTGEAIPQSFVGCCKDSGFHSECSGNHGRF